MAADGWINVSDVTIDTEKHTYSAVIEISGLDYKEKYRYQAWARDALGAITSPEVVLQTIPVFDWGANDFNFNVPVSIHNEPIADFIIERYTEDFWYVEKWASGKAVCYGKKSLGTVAVNKAWGNLYESDSYNQTFPSGLFIAAPEYFNIHTFSGGATLTCGYGYTPGATKEETGTYFFYRPNGSSLTVSNVYVQFHAIGKWR